MAEKPILFSTPMVQAILDGRKSQTRRLVKPQPPHHTFSRMKGGHGCEIEVANGYFMKPPYQSGDRLWVRETWFCDECDPDCAGKENEDECPFNHVGNCCYGYKAQYTTGWHEKIKWRPSIFMPKEAARIWLTVTEVRVERLQEISDCDAWAEGIVDEVPFGTAQTLFRELWDSINAKRGYGWDTNPWVWVISFEKEG